MQGLRPGGPDLVQVAQQQAILGDGELLVAQPHLGVRVGAAQQGGDLLRQGQIRARPRPAAGAVAAGVVAGRLVEHVQPGQARNRASRSARICARARRSRDRPGSAGSACPASPRSPTASAMRLGATETSTRRP